MKRRLKVCTILIFAVLVALLFLLSPPVRLSIAWIRNNSPNRVRNVHIQALLSDINKIETVHRVRASERGAILNINVYVEESFTENDKLELIKLTEMQLNYEVLRQLAVEFNMKGNYLPDIDILIRDRDGRLQYHLRLTEPY